MEVLVRNRDLNIRESIYILVSVRIESRTLFSLYLHNQWTDVYKLSCTGKLQMRTIRICVACTKVITND